mmetsp:Transcript_15057/g.30513  ORF Transcript_15057/g.30513 Transcript_15057/m.30513 type:complete len:90 (+) Transcript_15057:66-335(+)
MGSERGSASKLSQQRTIRLPTDDFGVDEALPVYGPETWISIAGPALLNSAEHRVDLGHVVVDFELPPQDSAGAQEDILVGPGLCAGQPV